MSIQEIIKYLKQRETPFGEIKSFSKMPGIYAVFFIGDQFPAIGDKVSKHQIIYIGKTESSQEKRDAKTHFTSGKTGSSTLRKSIGSLLCAQENLKPVPRNNTDYLKGKFSHFKFDEKSEEIITEWMVNNLALSFYEHPGTPYEIDQLETEIINQLVPVLNISKNAKNNFSTILQQLRKNCAAMAASFPEQFKSLIPLKENYYIPLKPNPMAKSGKYIEIWGKQREAIQEALQNGFDRNFLQLNPADFKKVGDRGKSGYSFNLEYKNGMVYNNIGGTAVARDLAKVLESSPGIMKILNTGHFKIKMDKNFCLCIERKS